VCVPQEKDAVDHICRHTLAAYICMVLSGSTGGIVYIHCGVYIFLFLFAKRDIVIFYNMWPTRGVAKACQRP